MATELNQQELETQQMADAFGGLSHPTRIAIVRILAERKKMTVSEIFGELNQHQAVISRHLRVLRENGVVIPDRLGKNVSYRLTTKGFVKVLESMEKAVRNPEVLDLYRGYNS